MIEAPTLQALVLADQVYVDRDTNKFIISGTFRQLLTAEIPGLLNRETYAYVCMTNVYGTINVHLRYIDLETNQVLLHSTELPVYASSPVETVELKIPIAPLPMPHEGVYAFEVHVGDEMLGAFRVSVRRVSEEG